MIFKTYAISRDYNEIADTPLIILSKSKLVSWRTRKSRICVKTYTFDFYRAKKNVWYQRISRNNSWRIK